MKLLVLSDLHGDCSIVRKIYEKTKDENLTLLVICGDLTHFGNLKQVKEILKEFTDLETQVLFVPGNCDPKELVALPSIYDAVNIHGRYREIEGLGFIGIGGSTFCSFQTPFEISEHEMKRILDEARRGLNVLSRFVLISHTPPANTKVDLTSSGIHAGSVAIREFVEKERPTLVLCGHIHEAKGTDIIDDVLIVNPGSAHRGLYAAVDVNGDIKARLDAL